MANMTGPLYNLRLLDELAAKKTCIHNVHPLAKLLTTLIYLGVVVSFGKYEISNMLPYVFYPVLVFTFAELPLAPIFKRLLFVLPLIIGIGILNPIFDHHSVLLGGIVFSRGWITFFVLFIKCVLTVTAGLLLVATTGMNKLGVALRMLKVPKIFVLQLLLTYRYISVLMEEVARMLRAYALRAPGQKGIRRNVWGSFAGQLILRTFDRAQRVYEAMSLRGFAGEYHTGEAAGIRFADFAYLAGWSLFFVLARVFNLPALIGSLFTGGIS